MNDGSICYIVTYKSIGLAGMVRGWWQGMSYWAEMNKP